MTGHDSYLQNPEWIWAVSLYTHVYYVYVYIGNLSELFTIQCLSHLIYYIFELNAPLNMTTLDMKWCYYNVFDILKGTLKSLNPFVFDSETINSI